jgi:hypothetical protein
MGLIRVLAPHFLGPISGDPMLYLLREARLPYPENTRSEMEVLVFRMTSISIQNRQS